MVMTVADPVAGRQRRRRDQRRTRSDLLPLAIAISAPAILRLGLTVVRRLIAGKVSLAVEFDLRERVYAHLQALELGFFDGQQTGQLMSRATVDLQSIRFFLGYGLIFLTQNALTITLGEHRDVRDQAMARGAGADPGAVRDPGRGALQPALAAGACRRSSSGSPS